MENEEMNNSVKRPGGLITLSILALILCCIPFGIPALVYASKANSLWEAKRYSEAYDATAKARAWIIASVATGLIVNILALIYYMNVVNFLF